MATNQTGIAIVIKAWLPTGKGLDEQFAALSLVKTAHASGDYAPLLGAAKIEAVQTEQKTRRVEAEVVSHGDIDADAADYHAGEPEPAATDDALAERPDMTEPDGTVVEPAAEKPRGKKVA